jgi:hypothetical protein
MNNNAKKGCLVQRLIIIHFGLVPENSPGGFDETASNEELCEQILYYDEYERSFPSDTRCRYNYEEAIKFAGLCTALYSIQSTIDSQMKNQEEQEPTNTSLTKEVYLSTCTLVFIPLESSEVEGVVAVAQLPRRPQQKKSENTGKTKHKLAEDHLRPEEIRHKLQKAHDLFKLMNRGIHRRLCNSNIEPEKYDGDGDGDGYSHKRSTYVGMNELYDILKRLRKSQLQLRYQNPANDDKESLEEVLILEKQLKELTDSLPIDALRMDLRQFYDSFLRHLGESEC